MDALIAVIVFALLLVAALAWVWRALRNRGHEQQRNNLDSLPRVKPQGTPWWKVTLYLVMASVASMLIDDARASEPAPQKSVVLKLSDCPPPGPGMTPIVAFIINTQADAGKLSSTCVRFADRPLQPTRPQKKTATRTNLAKE